jgi:hypothetical protein
MDLIAPASPGRPESIEEIRQAVEKSTLNAGVKRVMSVLIEDARNTIVTARQLEMAGFVDFQKLDTALNHVQQNMEVWFNNSMERVAGWYKRKTQAVILTLAVVVTVALNVDTVLIVKRLSSDAALRQALVAQAESLAKSETQTSTGAAAIDASLTRLQATGIPLGWGEDALPKDKRDIVWYLTKLFGLLLTAGAASLGAPFWFDVLNKIITVRSTGKAPEETPKSPKELPRPVGPGQSAPPLPPAPPAAPLDATADRK